MTLLPERPMARPRSTRRFAPIELHSRLSPLPPVILSESGRSPEMPIAMWAAQWIVYVRDRRGAARNTVESYRQAIEQWLHFANQADLSNPRSVTVHHIDDYLVWLTRRRLNPRTVNHRRSALNRFFRYLQREGAVSANPVELTEPQKEQRPLPKGLSIADQLHALEVLAKTMKTPQERRDLALIATLFLAGLRCEEAATRRLEDLDLTTGVLHILGKGDRERQVPVDKKLGMILREYLTVTRPRLVERHSSRHSDADYIFVQARVRELGKPLNPRSIFYIVRDRVSPIVGRNVSPHVLRHSLAQRLLDGSGDLQLVQAVLGHVDLRTTQLYARMSTRAQRAAFMKAMKATEEEPTEEQG